ncbi:hypothetical protein [Blastopirellula marina]|uniref:Uncharacterized protein n=1 Tax=Blastopirellula marina DSM 3645 TaxID=314230 RepID=A3ZX21_9BACT|nr:hypothetical protein [Blastopirellula marina]EAQ78898.1 hypothetical protein DSM3645_27498 [Blastopirellula marina DSM 3645]
MIDICKTNRATDESEFIPICSAEQYQKLWRPAISKLNLPMLAALPALEIALEFKTQFLSEVETLKMWAISQNETPYVQMLLEAIELIQTTLDSTDLDEYEISFG